MAVELLIRNFDGPGGRMKGDIVDKRPSPFEWGKDEGLPNYGVICIEDKELEDLTMFQRHKPVLYNEKGETIISLRSTFGVNIDTLPFEDRLAISLGQKAYSTWSTITARLIDYIALGEIAWQHQ